MQAHQRRSNWHWPHFQPTQCMLYVFEGNEAVIKMISKGRSPTMRQMSRTHGVALDWLFDRSNWTQDPNQSGHQKPTRRHVNQRKLHTWWVGTISFVCWTSWISRCFPADIFFQAESRVSRPRELRKVLLKKVRRWRNRDEWIWCQEPSWALMKLLRKIRVPPTARENQQLDQSCVSSSGRTLTRSSIQDPTMYSQVWTETSMPVTTMTTVDLTWNPVCILLYCHVIQPSGSRTSLRDQCFLWFCTHCCRALLLARLWYHCSQWWFLRQYWVLTHYCCAITNWLSSSLRALLSLFSCFGHACILFIISWWDIHDHSGSGALPVGGRAQRSPRRWTLNMRTKSLWMWNREDLNTMSRTVTHLPSSLVPSRASSRVIVRRWDSGFCSRALQLSYKGHMFWAGWQAQHGMLVTDWNPKMWPLQTE